MALNISPFSFNYHGLPQGAPQPQKPVWGPPDMAEQLQKGIAGILPALGEAYKGASSQMNAERAAQAIRGITPGGQVAGLAQPGGPYAPQPQAPIVDNKPMRPPPEDIKNMIVQKASAAGIDPQYMLKMAEIESGFDPGAINKGSGAAGLFQFIPGTWRQFGQGSPLSVEGNIDAAIKLTKANQEQLRKELGIEPTSGHLYLAHQQGAGGAAELLRDPNRRAIDATQRQNIYSNLPASERGRIDTLTAGEFANRWTSKFGDKIEPGGGTQVASRLPPQRPETLAGAPPAPVPPQAALPPPEQQASLGPQGQGPIPLQQPQQPRNAQPLFSTAVGPQGTQYAELDPSVAGGSQVPGAVPAAPVPPQPSPQPQMAQAPIPQPPPQPAPELAGGAQPLPQPVPPPQAALPPQGAPPAAGPAVAGAQAGRGIPPITGPAQPQQIAMTAASINPNYRNALAYAIASRDPGVIQGVIHAGEKLLGGDEFSFVTGADGSIYRASKKTGQITPAIAGSKARETKEAGGIIYEAPPPGSPPGTPWKPVGGAAKPEVKEAGGVIYEPPPPGSPPGTPWKPVAGSAKPEVKEAGGVLFEPPPPGSPPGTPWRPVGGDEKPPPVVDGPGGSKLVWSREKKDYVPLAPQQGPDGKFRFGGSSVEAQALNHLMERQLLTEDQAANIASGKQVTGADGSVYFFMGTQLVSQQPGGPPKPVDPTPRVGDPEAPKPIVPPKQPAVPPPAPAPLVPPKVNLPPSEVTARIGLGNKFTVERLPKIREDIEAGLVDIPNGNRAKLISGYGRPGEIKREIDSGKEALLRGLTGAGMSENEAREYVNRYSISYRDDRATILSKLNGLEGDLVASRDAMLAGRNITDEELTGKKKKPGEIKTPGGATLRKVD